MALEKQGTSNDRFLISRDSLLQQLHLAAKNKLTLVVAPPGSGKTTLLSQWTNDPPDGPIYSHTLQSLDQLPPFDSSESGIVIVDGCDSLVDTASFARLQTVISEAPIAVRFVVAGRVEPPFLRAARDADVKHVALFDARALAFDKQEVQCLAELLLGSQITADAAEDLVATTHGWAAGCTLGLLASRDQISTYVDDYLHEVFSSMPKPVQQFLLETSPLEVLHPELCNAVVRRDDSARVLAYLSANSIFIESNRAGELSYLPSFRNYLMGKLPLTHFSTEVEVLQRAADWCIAQADIANAGLYLARAGNWEGLVEVIDQNILQLFYKGETQVALDLVNRVPLAYRSNHRNVVLQKAALETLLGQSLAAEATSGLVGLSRPLSAGESLLVDCIHSAWVEQHASVESAISSGQAFLDRLEELPDNSAMGSRAFVQCNVHRWLARAQWLAGDTHAARENLNLAIEQSRGLPYSLVSSLGALALIDAWSGRLGNARVAANQALDLARLEGWIERSCSANALVAMAVISRIHGDTQTARAYLQQASTAARESAKWNVLTTVAIEAALLELAMNNPSGGLADLLTYQAALEYTPPTLLANRLRSTEARLSLATGDITMASQLVESFEYATSHDLRAVATQAALANHDTERARSLLTEWCSDGELANELARELLIAITDELDGFRGRARKKIISAIEIAEPEEYVQPFVDAGPVVHRLIRAVGRTNLSPYVNRLVDATSRFDDTSIQASLSEREMMVLRLLPSSLSNTEIAGQLYVSLNTVKTHLRSVYKSLGVHGRQEAVERAEQLGII